MQWVDKNIEIVSYILLKEGVPTGWKLGLLGSGLPGPSSLPPNLNLMAGGFLYDRHALNKELSSWVEVAGKPHLVIPYSYPLDKTFH